MILSVVLATFNEEKKLEACLTSVKNFADEIIVVDGGSTDGTVEIAKRYGARVEITDNPPIFHINKQKAIDMANGDWILQLDADERVTSELAEEIKSKILNPDPEINGYWIPRKNWFLGRFLMKGGQYPDYTMRLYRKGKGRLPCVDVHEQAVVEGRVDKLLNPLIHMADTDFDHYLRRWNRYTDLMGEELEKKISGNILMAIYYGINYILISPIYWFLLSYIRHKGFIDSWQGFTFSFFSALRFPVSYLKYWKRK